MKNKRNIKSIKLSLVHHLGILFILSLLAFWTVSCSGGSGVVSPENDSHGGSSSPDQLKADQPVDLPVEKPDTSPTDKLKAGGDGSDWDRKHDGGDRKRKRGLEDRFRRLCIDREGIGRIKTYLIDNGFTETQIKPVMLAIVRIAFEMIREGDAFELDPRVISYLRDELGLTMAEVGLIVGIARRIVNGMTDDCFRDRDRCDHDHDGGDRDRCDRDHDHHGGDRG